MKRYSNDPYWLTARFDSTCSHCKGPVKKGTRAFYYPRDKTILCGKEECGGKAALSFEAAAMDESFMAGQTW